MINLFFFKGHEMMVIRINNGVVSFSKNNTYFFPIQALGIYNQAKYKVFDEMIKSAKTDIEKADLIISDMESDGYYLKNG